jgi:hypothetical protein
MAREIEIADDSPYCDNGCGDRATVSFAHVGLCDDCAEKAIREALEEAGLGRMCATITHLKSGPLAVCLSDSGIEHDHY